MIIKLIVAAAFSGGSTGSQGDHGPQKFSCPLRGPLIFLERYKMLNFEYTVYCKYLRVRKAYKE